MRNTVTDQKLARMMRNDLRNAASRAGKWRSFATALDRFTGGARGDFMILDMDTDPGKRIPIAERVAGLTIVGFREELGSAPKIVAEPLLDWTLRPDMLSDGPTRGGADAELVTRISELRAAAIASEAERMEVEIVGTGPLAEDFRTRLRHTYFGPGIPVYVDGKLAEQQPRGLKHKGRYVDLAKNLDTDPDWVAAALGWTEEGWQEDRRTPQFAERMRPYVSMHIASDVAWMTGGRDADPDPNFRLPLTYRAAGLRVPPGILPNMPFGHAAPGGSPELAVKFCRDNDLPPVSGAMFAQVWDVTKETDGGRCGARIFEANAGGRQSAILVCMRELGVWLRPDGNLELGYAVRPSILTAKDVDQAFAYHGAAAMIAEVAYWDLRSMLESVAKEAKVVVRSAVLCRPKYAMPVSHALWDAGCRAIAARPDLDATFPEPERLPFTLGNEDHELPDPGGPSMPP